MKVWSIGTTAAVVVCPKCDKNIILEYEPSDKPNSGIGNLRQGEQRFTAIVCMNRNGTDKYCDHSQEHVFPNG